MKIEKRILFSKEDDADLLTFLLKNGISFKDNYLAVLEIYDDHPAWPVIEAYVKENDLLCLSETLFTKTELDNADWLSVRSKWRNGYPQPEDAFEYQNITYTCANYCYECGCGLQQVQPFRFKKEPKWGNRYFMMLNWIEDELFVSAPAKELLERSQFSGFYFSEVNDKKGNAPIPGIYQLVVTDLLSYGLNPNASSIDSIYLCPSCGIEKYHPTGIGRLEFKKDIFNNAPDIVKTSEVFGWGKGASHKILIRNNVYSFLVENHMDRNLVFEPISLV